MASDSAASQYRPSQEALRAVCARHGLPPPSRMRPLEGGVVNPVLRLDTPAGSAVLRINVRDPDNPKVAKEAWVLRFLGEVRRAAPRGAWRVPRVLGADTTHDLLPHDYLLLELVAGQPGHRVYDASPSERVPLQRQVGRALAELHGIRLPGDRYGDWDAAAEALGTDDDWRTATEHAGAACLDEAARLDLLDPGEVGSVRDWLAAHLDVIPRRPRRCLLHHDLSVWNVLLRRRRAPGPDGSAWRVATLLDFEWSAAGAAPSDFSTAFAEIDEPAEAVAFLDGYTGGAPLDRGFVQQAHYHELVYHLALLAVAQRHWGRTAVRTQRANVLRLLRGQPSAGFAANGYGPPF